MRNLILLSFLIFQLSVLTACNLKKNSQNSSKTKQAHHHTSKVSGYIKINFLNKDIVLIKTKEEVTDIEIKVFHKLGDTSKILYKVEEPLTQISLKEFNKDLMSGYLVVSVNGLVNGRGVANSSSYKLDEQMLIDSEKKKLNERSLKYESN